MTIRTRLTVLFISIVTILLIAFCVAIYLEGEIYRKQEYQNRLRQEALTAATILFNKQEISPDLLRLLDKNQITTLNQEEIVIYDNFDKVVYESGSDNLIIQPQILAQIRKQKELFWEQSDLEMYGVIIKNENKDYIVLASAFDKYGLSKQRNLALMLIFGCILMVLISSITGWFFAGRMLLPIKQMIQKIDKIRASRLSLRLDEGNKSDELAQLSMRFNQMLDRLEKAFQSQRSFVSHASHELRTPLTAITGQIQVSLLANDSPEELKLMIKSVLEDVQQLNKLSNNLLDLTSIDSEDTKIKKSLVNILEIIWHIRAELLKKNENYEILISLDENTDFLPEVRANESLLYTAILNLIDNGAKFSSENAVDVRLKSDNENLIIVFHNNGSYIPSKELNLIFEPFRRGSNARQTKGHGVGLPLTNRIIQLHDGKLTVNSSEKEGTTFTLFLPK